MLRGRPVGGCFSCVPSRCSPLGVPQTDRALRRRQAQNQSQSNDAAARVITEARTAIGGEAKLAAVKSFVVTGRTRQVRGENLVPIEFEIQAELPDKFARRDEFPAQDAGPTVTGFNGDRFVQSPAPQPHRRVPAVRRRPRRSSSRRPRACNSSTRSRTSPG